MLLHFFLLFAKNIISSKIKIFENEAPVDASILFLIICRAYLSTRYNNGNTTQKNAGGQIQNFVYDVDNRLIEVKDSSGNTIAAYTYDPFGRRIKKTAGGSSVVEMEKR